MRSGRALDQIMPDMMPLSPTLWQRVAGGGTQVTRTQVAVGACQCNRIIRQMSAAELDEGQSNIRCAAEQGALGVVHARGIVQGRQYRRINVQRWLVRESARSPRPRCRRTGPEL